MFDGGEPAGTFCIERANEAGEEIDLRKTRLKFFQLRVTPSLLCYALPDSLCGHLQARHAHKLIDEKRFIPHRLREPKHQERIVESGDKELALRLEAQGYAGVGEAAA